MTPCLVAQGGGIRINSGGQAHLMQCNIFDNEATQVGCNLLNLLKSSPNAPMWMPCVLLPQGGGLYIYSGQVHLTLCNIFDNEADGVS